MQTIPCCFIICNNNDRIYVALCCCLGAFVDSIYVRLWHASTLIICDKCKLYYTLYMIILVYAGLHKAFVVFYEALYHTSFFVSLLQLVYILFDDGILLVYYIAKYIVIN